MEKRYCETSGKICYSKRDAGGFLNWLRSRKHKHGHRNKVIPCRYYFCNSCGTWHLTSVPKRK